MTDAPRLRVVVAPCRAQYKCCLSAAPPFGGWRHHLARWEACHYSQSSGRISIGRRLYGQARRQRIRPCVFLCRIRTLRLPTNPVPLQSPYSGGTMDAGHFGQFRLVKITAEKPYNQASPERAVVWFSQPTSTLAYQLTIVALSKLAPKATS